MVTVTCRKISSFDPEAERLAPALSSALPTVSSMAAAPESSASASTSISRQVIGSLFAWSKRVAVTLSSATSTWALACLPGHPDHGPFGIQDGHGMQALARRDLLDLGEVQPGPHVAAAPLAERRVQLLPGVLAHRQLEVPALVIAAHSAPQRDLVLEKVEVLGVEVGGAQVDPSRIRVLAGD